MFKGNISQLKLFFDWFFFFKRYVGGMRLNTHLSGVVNVLQDLMKDCSSVTHIWAIHSICLSAESAGN